MRITLAFTTPLKPAKAFEYIAEDFFTNHQKWDPDLVENKKLSDGPIGVGTKGRSVTKFAGKQTAYFEITTFSKPAKFSFINTSGPVNLQRTYTFLPDKDGTKISFIFDMEPRLIMKPIFPIIAVLTKKRVYKNIETLKSLLKEPQ